MSTTNFDDWSQKKFVRWLRKNYPDPKSRYVEVTLNVDLGGGVIERIAMADEYELCIEELAWELEMKNGTTKDFPEAVKAHWPEDKPVNFTLLIRPAKRRKAKQMHMRIPNDRSTNL